MIRSDTWRRHDVRRVEPPAEPHLEHRELDLRGAKRDERRHRGRLEEAQVGRPLEHLEQERRERVVVERRAVDPNALAESPEMRRRVEPDMAPSRPRHRIDERRDRPFAVRPGDVRHLERPLRVAEARARVGHRTEAEAHPERDAGVELVECPLERRRHGGFTARAAAAAT